MPPPWVNNANVRCLRVDCVFRGNELSLLFLLFLGGCLIIVVCRFLEESLFFFSFYLLNFIFRLIEAFINIVNVILLL